MAQVITGARGRVRITTAEGSRIVGWIGGVNVTRENTLTDVDIMGQLEVGDLAETAHKCNFSINYFKAVNDAGTASATAKGEFVPNTPAAVGIDNSSQDTGILPLRSQTYFDVVLEDDETDAPFFIMEKCKFEGGTGQVDARGIWQGTWNFRAIRCYEI